MPLTPAETAEFDQGVAAVDETVAELARAYQDDAAAYGEQAAFANTVCFLLGDAGWTREELAALLGRVVRLVPPGQAARTPDPVLGDPMSLSQRYFVTVPGEPEREVDLDGWCAAEQAAGFHSKGGPGHAATAGFTGSNGMSGRVEFASQDPEET